MVVGAVVNLHNLVSPGRRASGCACGGFMVIVFMKVGRPIHRGWHHPLGRRAKLYGMEEGNWAAWHRHSSSLLPVHGQDVTS